MDRTCSLDFSVFLMVNRCMGVVIVDAIVLSSSRVASARMHKSSTEVTPSS